MEGGTAATAQHEKADVSRDARIDIGGFVLCRSTKTLYDKSGAIVGLGFQASSVLSALAVDAGRTVSKERLMSAAWSDVHVTENNLVQCIRQIRRALGDQDGKIVRTVPKVGYALVLDDRQPTRSGIQESQTRVSKLAGMAPFVALGLFVLLAVFLSASYLFEAPGSRKDEAEMGLQLAPSFDVNGPSIVVLPFESISGDERSERLGLGMAMEISGALARHGELRVLAAETSDAVTDPIANARNHSVRLVVDGTVLAQGQTLQATARLSDAVERRVLWSQTWRGPAQNIFQWQDEALSRILSSISAVWTGAIQGEVLRRTRKRPTESLDAYELFLLGSAEKHQFTEDGLRRAVKHLERATQIDPDFARAWVALNLARVYLSDFAATRQEAEALYQASLEASRRAFDADPSDPQVLVRYSGLVANEGDLDAAARILRSAVRAAPSDADILAQAAFTAAWRGITGDDPVHWAERARELNLAPPDWYSAAYGMALFHAGRVEEAVESLAAASMNDVMMVRAAAEALTGDLDAARATANELRNRAPNMVAVDLVPNAGDDLPESWQSFLEGARLAGVAIDAEHLEAER